MKTELTQIKQRYSENENARNGLHTNIKDNNDRLAHITVLNNKAQDALRQENQALKSENEQVK